jgi:iron(III)-salmochelin esterase
MINKATFRSIDTEPPSRLTLILKALQYSNMRIPGAHTKNAPGWRASILILTLSCALSLWLQGCVPSGQAPHNPSEVPADAGLSASAASRQEAPGRPDSGPSIKTPVVGGDKKDRERTPRSPEQIGHSAAPPSERNASTVSVEKLPGYRLPAEYLFIPSRYYPDATVAVMLPADYDKESQKKYPLVIAFGGAGECAKPPAQGALAWLRYYKTDEAAEAAKGGSLSVSDFRGLVTDKQLKDFNRTLEHRPYTGVILACPSSPLIWAHGGVDLPEYEAFVMRELIPELRKRYRTDPDKIGVDGVSMGGARSMYYGFKYPGVFSSVGSVQGAFGPYFDTYRTLIKDNKEILANRAIQLVTSDGDVMARSVDHLHKMLQEENIPHSFMVLTGPHDYIFNQGPGALALLLFHHQALGARVPGPVK